jgi:peptidoglycan/xylan/chitin deacetylase (PgdA/CDA1 family)
VTLLRATLLTTAALAYLPAATALRPVRQLMTSVLPAHVRGIGRPGHVALTYDDGPDHRSTPLFVEVLATHQAHATFFMLGEHVAPHRSLVADVAAAGHELAVHGWDHSCVATKRPGALVDEIRRTRDLLEDIGGRPVRWYRPPYGVSSTESIWAARRSGLQTALWSAWGRDWERGATAGSISRTVRHQLRTGGTVLLHDTDRTAAPGSWWRTLAASEALLTEWRAAGVEVGALSDHFHSHATRRTTGVRDQQHAG